MFNLKFKSIRCLPFLLAFFFGACTEENQIKDGNPIVISPNKSKAIKNQMKLSLVADSVDYVKLSTPDSILLSERLVSRICKDRILVIDKNTNGVFLFKRDGSFIKEFSFQDENGRELFPHPVDGVIDSASNAIYILDSKYSRIFTYNFDGKYIDFFSTGYRYHKLLLKNNTFIFVIPAQGILKGGQQGPGFVYITDLKGKPIKKIPFKSPYKHNRLANYSSYFFKDTLVFWQESSDSVFNIDANYDLSVRYIIKDKDLIPKEKLFTDSADSYFPTHWDIDQIFEFPTLLYFEGLYKMRENNLIYHKSTKEINDLIYDFDVWDRGFFNDIDGGPPFQPYSQFDEKVMYAYIQPDKFLRFYNHPSSKSIVPLSDVFKLRLDRFVNSLRETDNTIIQVVYLKQN